MFSVKAILVRRGCLSIGLVLLIVVINGCAMPMSPSTESDQNWKKWDPTWKSPTPENPPPTYDMRGRRIWPNNQQDP